MVMTPVGLLNKYLNLIMILLIILVLVALKYYTMTVLVNLRKFGTLHIEVKF